MKKTGIILFTCFLFAIILFAQSPEKLSYQAVIRDSKSQLICGKQIGMRISILEDSASGAPVYTELQTPISNNNGLVTIEIGSGKTSDKFSAIDWGNNSYFLKTEIDPAGGTDYSIIGSTQLLSVPYALYSKKSERTSSEVQNLEDVLHNNNSANGQIKNLYDPSDDSDAVNKSYVTLRVSSIGDTLFLGKNQHVIISGISAANSKAPTVKTLNPSDISLTSSAISANITDNGWNDITEYGFEYSTKEGFSEGSGTKVVVGKSNIKGEYSTVLNELTSHTPYYYKAYTTNSKGTSYGEEKSFITLASINLLGAVPNYSTKISDVIGSGYDITTSYANSTDIKSSVLDYDSLRNNNLIHLDENQLTGELISASGSDMSSYQSNINSYASVKAKYGGFKGEIDLRFDKDKTSSSAYSFATASSRQIKTAYCIDKDYRLNISKLYPYLTEQFKKDIMTIDTPEIFNRYGTDVMLGGMWGGRADYNMSAKKQASSSGESIGAYVSARYKSALGNGGSTVDEIDAKYKNEFQTNTVSAKTTVKGGGIETVNNSTDFTNWMSSINDSNSVFIEYYPGAIIPIYEFVQDSSRRQFIETARDNYLKNKQIYLNDPILVQTANVPFDVKGFTNHVGSGDKDIDSKSGRNTFVNASVSLFRQNSTSIACKVYLDVKEEHSDYSEFSGSYTFYINSDKEIPSFTTMTYTLPRQTISGCHHDYVDLSDKVDCNWLSNLQIKFDEDSSNDGPYIGMKGTLKFNYNVRSSD